MRVIKVVVKNYRNIDGICVELNELCSYIIGENNLGKSNFLDLLDTVCAGRAFGDEDYTNPELPIEVFITIKLSQGELGFLEDNFSVEDFSIVNIRYRQEISEVYPSAFCTDTDEDIPLKKLRKLNYCKYESTASPTRELRFDNRKGIGKLMSGFVDVFVSRGGESSFLNTRQIDDFVKYMNLSFSRIHGFREYGIKTSIFTDTSDVVANLCYLSDGERKLEDTGSGVQYIAMASVSILCYVMELYKSKSVSFEDRLFTDEQSGEKILPVILSIDEPEVHLHPYLQRFLIRYYRQVLSNRDNDFKKLLKDCFGIDGILGQIIIVTHSTDALVGDYRNLIRFYKKSGKIEVVSGVSQKIHIPFAQEKHLIMRFPELKEAFYSHCAILIEGETEYGCIREFAEKLSIPIDDLGICFINAKGEKSIKSLSQLLEIFGIKSVAIYDSDVKVNKEPSGLEFFTSEICFEAEIVRKLFSTGNQQLVRDIALELDSRALDNLMDIDFVKGYFKKKQLLLDAYTPKLLGEVLDDAEDEFCNLFSAWFTAKKGILLGRIVGAKLTAELIPECYSDAIFKAQEIAKNAR